MSGTIPATTAPYQENYSDDRRRRTCLQQAGVTWKIYQDPNNR